jgi:potassium efflux system protein
LDARADDAVLEVEGGEATSNVSVDVLTARIKEAEADQDLDEQSRQALIELYRKSIGNLEDQAADQSATTTFRRSIETAPVETREMEEEIAAFQQQSFDPDPGFNELTSTTDIAQALLKERANLAAVDADVSRLSLQLQAEQDRLVAARKELSDANVRQARQSIDSNAGVAVNEPAQITKAREWFRSTSLAAMGAKIKRLDQELLSHSSRIDLLKMQLKRRELTLGNLTASVAAIEDELGKRREDDATEAMAMAQAAQVAAEGKHPLLVKVAEENAALSKQLVAMSQEIDKVSKAATKAEAKAKALEDDYRGVRQKLEVAGMNKALGRILQDQRTALPNTRKIQSQLDKREQLIADIALQQLLLDEHLKDLADINAYAQQQMAEVRRGRAEKPLDREAMTAELVALLKQQRSLYKKTSDISGAYLQGLSDLEYAESRLLTTVDEYDDFLGERLLWVRSVPNPGLGDLVSFTGASLHYFTPESLRVVATSLIELDRGWLVLLPCLLIAGVLILKKAELLERLAETNRHLGNPLSDHFRYSLQAVLYTALLALPGPLLAGAVGLKLRFAEDANPLSFALGVALLWIMQGWFFIAFFRQMCRPEGLAHRHFRWHFAVLKPLRQELLLLMQTFLPVSFVTALLGSLDSTGLEWGVLRISLVCTMLLFAWFFVRLLREDGKCMQALTMADPMAMLVRWRRAWLVAAIVIPLALTGLALAGYVYTAIILTGSFVQSFWVVIGVILVQQLSVRLLRMTSARLNYQALQEERKRQLQELFESAEESRDKGEMVQEPAVDLEHLGRDSLKLVNIVVGILAIVGLLVVWADVLPAIGYLDTINLWSYSGIQDGAAAVLHVSLVDLGLVFLIIGTIYFVYKNMASLLELLLLQVASMSASDRYTIITVTRYIVLTVGFLLVTSMLGMSWSQFQWLAAALGVGIGFGLQEIVANFISGLIILFERPIRVGDRVTVGDVDGIVTRIQIRATTILTWDRQELLVPNKEFITGRVLNWSLSDEVSRLVLQVGIAYGSDVGKAMALVEQVAREHEKVLDDPPPFVVFEAFGDNTLNLSLRCFLDDMSARLVTTSELNQAINRVFNAAGIVIAYPQRDIHFDADNVLNINLKNDLSKPNLPVTP